VITSCRYSPAWLQPCDGQHVLTTERPALCPVSGRDLKALPALPVDTWRRASLAKQTLDVLGDGTVVLGDYEAQLRPFREVTTARRAVF
jgi:hypothetical protein